MVGIKPIEKIAQNLKVDPSKPQDIVKAILKEKAGLQFIDLSDLKSDSIASNGNLTEKGVEILLARSGLGVGYTVKALGGGGANTLQLFLVMEKGSVKYILKGLKKAFEEVQNLEIIRKSILGNLIMDPAKTPVKGIPVLAMDEQNLTYLDLKGVEHHVSVINAASGKAISDLIFAWTKPEGGKTPASEDMVSKALYRMGNNIGIIHKQFMQPVGSVTGKTYVHGDMHPYNVFYDDKNDRIIFIDNESFAISIQSPRDISVDLMKFYGRLVATNYKERHAYRPKGGEISEKLFYDVVVKPFVVGYIDAYGKEGDPKASKIRQDIFKRLYEVISNQGALKTYFDNVKTDLSPTELYKSQQLYAKPMFTEIAKEKGFDMGTSSGKPSLFSRMMK